MSMRLEFFLALVLVLQPLAGMLLGRHAPHEHILVGGVTPAQLRAHVEEEARALQAETQAHYDLLNSPILAKGGVILSVPFRGDILSLPFQIEMAMLTFSLLTIPFLCYRHYRARVTYRWRAPALFDPPPRLLSGAH